MCKSTAPCGRRLQPVCNRRLQGNKNHMHVIERTSNMNSALTMKGKVARRLTHTGTPPSPGTVALSTLPVVQMNVCACACACAITTTVCGYACTHVPAVTATEAAAHKPAHTCLATALAASGAGWAAGPERCSSFRCPPQASPPPSHRGCRLWRILASARLPWTATSSTWVCVHFEWLFKTRVQKL